MWSFDRVVAGDVRFLSGDWSGVASKLLGEADAFGLYDLILTAETIYSPASATRLWSFIKTLLKPGGVALLAQKSYYFGVGGSVAAFKELVKSDEGMGFECRTIRVWDDGASNRREVFEVSRKLGAAPPPPAPPPTSSSSSAAAAATSPAAAKAPAGAADVDSSADETGLLPRKSIRYIMKQATGSDGTVTNDAVAVVQRCTTEFINFLASEAAAQLRNQQASASAATAAASAVGSDGAALPASGGIKAPNAIRYADFASVLTTLGFKPYAEPLKAHMLQVYGEQAALEKKKSKQAAAAAAMAAAAAAAAAPPPPSFAAPQLPPPSLPPPPAAPPPPPMGAQQPAPMAVSTGKLPMPPQCLPCAPPMPPMGPGGSSSSASSSSSLMPPPVAPTPPLGGPPPAMYGLPVSPTGSVPAPGGAAASSSSPYAGAGPP